MREIHTFFLNLPAYNLKMKLDSVTIQNHSKPVVLPDVFTDLQEAWRLLGFVKEQPTIVLVGGAGGMSGDDVGKVQEFFEKELIPFAREKNAAILDGGTDNGVMAAMGRALAVHHVDIPLVGVVARGIETIDALLEPHHSHFIFCPGSNWGDESEWIAAAASALSNAQPTAASLINGGQITWEDARNNIQYGRPVIVAEGSGRTADVIADTSTGIVFDAKALALIRTGKIHVANFFNQPERFMEKLKDLMK